MNKNSFGQTEFYFKRIVHNLDETKQFPIPKIYPATFQEQLKSLNRAYSITVIEDEEHEIKFIKNVLCEGYPEASLNNISIDEIES